MVMKMHYLLPVLFGLGFSAVGMGLLFKAYNSGDSSVPDDEITVMVLKGAGLLVVGLAFLGIIIWKSGIFRRRI